MNFGRAIWVAFSNRGFSVHFREELFVFLCAHEESSKNTFFHVVYESPFAFRTFASSFLVVTNDNFFLPFFLLSGHLLLLHWPHYKVIIVK